MCTRVGVNNFSSELNLERKFGICSSSITPGVNHPRMGIDTIEVLKFFVTAFSFVKYGKAVKLKWPDPWIEVKFIKTTKGA